MTDQEAPRVAPQGVTEYFAAVEAANATHRADLSALLAKYPDRYGNGDEALAQRHAVREGRRLIEDHYIAAAEAAWSALKASSDPLVKWIAENCGDYRSEAATVLEALPATPEELDDLAGEEEWCETWDSFRNRATDAGVLPEAGPRSKARTALFDQIDDETCCRLDAGARRRVAEALDTVIQEALEAARKPEAVSV